MHDHYNIKSVYQTHWRKEVYHHKDECNGSYPTEILIGSAAGDGPDQASNLSTEQDDTGSPQTHD
jgi:hypothetical protein